MENRKEVLERLGFAYEHLNKAACKAGTGALESELIEIANRLASLAIKIKLSEDPGFIFKWEQEL